MKRKYRRQIRRIRRDLYNRGIGKGHDAAMQNAVMLKPNGPAYMKRKFQILLQLSIALSAVIRYTESNAAD